MPMKSTNTGCSAVVFFLVMSLVLAVIPLQAVEEAVLSKVQISKRPGGFSLTETWKWAYCPADDMARAEPDFDDAAWQKQTIPEISSSISAQHWPGAAWFRCHFRIDDTLKGEMAVVNIRHLGASEIYLNGKLIHRYGRLRPGDSPGTTRFKVFTFDHNTQQVLALRYKNHALPYQIGMGFNQAFWLAIMDVQRGLSDIMESRLFLNRHKILLTVIPCILALLHIFLFLFYPRLKENLFYFFCLVGFAAFFFSTMERYLTGDPKLLILLHRIGPILNLFTVSFLLLTVYSILYTAIPRRFLYFVPVALVIAVYGVVRPLGWVNHGLFLFTSVVIFESLRSFLIHWPRERKGAWLILIGIVVLAILSVYQVFDVIIPMLAENTLEPPRSYYRVYTYGGTVFIICMSLYLSYYFSRVNKGLQFQLEQVKVLSRKNLLQERRARKREMEKKLLELENRRKGQELERARKVQLSMLPDCVDDYPGFDTCFHMETATEVGGDYYDYAVDPKGALVVAIGDATGHGLDAGLMVVVVKTLFISLGEIEDIQQFMERCSAAIKRMNMGHLFMGLSLVRIEDNRMVATGAGMPPILVYRQKTGTVEEMVFKSPPLGSFLEYYYYQKSTVLEPGDVVLMMSDGLPELFNEKDEMFGYENIKKVLQEAGSSSATDLIRRLCASAGEWKGDLAAEDDITLIALKKTSL